MSDETTNANNSASGNSGAGSSAAGNPGGTADRPAPSIRILAHFIRDLSFENVAAQQGNQTQGTPEISVTVNLDGGGIGENRFQMGMKINATAKVADTTRFIVELDYVGVFEINNVPQEHLHPFLFIECPRQILPYARRVVSDVTRDGGYPPLMLDNIDFAALYRQRLEHLRAQSGGAPAT